MENPMRSMKSAESTKKTYHHHHRDAPSVADRAKAKIRAKNEEESDEDSDEDHIPGLNPLPRKTLREEEKDGGEEKDQESSRPPLPSTRSKVSFDPALAMNELNLNEDSSNYKRTKSPLSPQQLAQLPSIEDETKRWMTQGFTKEQAERAAKKVIDDKRRAMMMESHPHNSMGNVEMEDLYGSKDDDVDEDTKYIAQSLIASPLAEFYGLDVPTGSHDDDYPDDHDDEDGSEGDEEHDDDEEEEEDDEGEEEEDEGDEAVVGPYHEDELDQVRPMSGHHAPMMSQVPPHRISYSPPPVTDAPGSYSVPGINSQNRHPTQYASDERSVYSQHQDSPPGYQQSFYQSHSGSGSFYGNTPTGPGLNNQQNVSPLNSPNNSFYGNQQQQRGGAMASGPPPPSNIDATIASFMSKGYTYAQAVELAGRNPYPHHQQQPPMQQQRPQQPPPMHPQYNQQHGYPYPQHPQPGAYGAPMGYPTGPYGNVYPPSQYPNNGMGGFALPPPIMTGIPFPPNNSTPVHSPTNAMSHHGSFYNQAQPPPAPMHNPGNDQVRDAEAEALRMAMLISQQEAEFGVNMYDVITAADEPEIQRLVNEGYPSDSAIMMIFESKGFISKGSNAVHNHSNHNMRPQSRQQPLPVNNNNVAPNNKNRGASIPQATSVYVEDDDEEHHHHKSLKDPNRRKSITKSFYKMASFLGIREDDTGLKSAEEKETKKKLKYKESDVKAIMKLGFKREQAVQALVENQHDRDMAIQALSGL